MTTEKLFALSLGLAGFIFMAQQARAEIPSDCGDYSAVAGALRVLYGEVSTLRRDARPDGAVELFLSPVSGSWTVIAILTDGTACLVSSGRNWPAWGFAQVLAADRT